MDPITQGVLGAALAQSVASRAEARSAALIGALAGMAADLDVLIRSPGDPLLTLEYHRHFSHSLLFVPLGALLVAGVMGLLLRNRLGFPRLYLFAFLGYSLSGVLDAFTSYGTHLWWPLSDARTAWNLIAVVDPVFTLGLMLPVTYATVRQAPRAAWVGLGFAVLYMSLAWVQSQRAEAMIRGVALERGHRPETVLVKPTLGNLLLWRSIYPWGDHFFVDAVRVGTDTGRVYAGGFADRFQPESLLDALPRNSVAFTDLLRFQSFSNGYLVAHPELPNVIGDVRYSMRPDGLTPLWGVEIDVGRPQGHVHYRFFRESSPKERQRFWSMLLGEDVDGFTPWVRTPGPAN